MSASIDVRIAERLGISEERARTLVQSLSKELRAQAQEDSVQLQGLGTFQKDDGSLTFHPSPSLSRVVNRRYEGLSAEDLSGTPVSASDEGGSSAVESSSADPDDRSRRDSSDGAPAYPVVDEQPGVGSGAGSSPGKQDPERESTSPGGAPAAASQASDTEAEGESDSRVGEASGSQSPDLFQSIMGVLLLVLLIGIGWFVLDRTGMMSSLLGSRSYQPPADTADTALQASTPDMNTERSPSQNQQSPPSRDTTAPEVPQDTMESSARTWAIVVASTADRASAKIEASRYKDRFSGSVLPVEIIESAVDNTTRYRVTVGDYRAKDSVLAALGELEPKLPDGAWILSSR